ncbi:hypothetical protein J6590_013108 [Homalodisca vitripennis]|nr:hypothetical protein J6590_013108 [Homalodisca vitripennis]
MQHVPPPGAPGFNPHQNMQGPPPGQPPRGPPPPAQMGGNSSYRCQDEPPSEGFIIIGVTFVWESATAHQHCCHSNKAWAYVGHYSCIVSDPFVLVTARGNHS